MKTRLSSEVYHEEKRKIKANKDQETLKMDFLSKFNII